MSKTGKMRRLINTTGSSVDNTFRNAKLKNSLRESKLGNNVFMQPTLIMKDLHKKSHFKAATSILMSNEDSLELKPNEHKDIF